MNTPRRATVEELRIAEIVITLVEWRIAERLEQCPYRDDGVKAYASAEAAIDAGIKDARNAVQYVIGGS